MTINVSMIYFAWFFLAFVQLPIIHCQISVINNEISARDPLISSNNNHRYSIQSQISSLKLLKDISKTNPLTNILVSKITICYDRFQHCASKLSAGFCGGFGQNSFYFWAHEYADYIMQRSDSHINIRCSPGLLKLFAKGFN